MSKGLLVCYEVMHWYWQPLISLYTPPPPSLKPLHLPDWCPNALYLKHLTGSLHWIFLCPLDNHLGHLPYFIAILNVFWTSFETNLWKGRFVPFPHTPFINAWPFWECTIGWFWVLSLELLLSVDHRTPFASFIYVGINGEVLLPLCSCTEIWYWIISLLKCLLCINLRGITGCWSVPSALTRRRFLRSSCSPFFVSPIAFCSSPVRSMADKF